MKLGVIHFHVASESAFPEAGSLLEEAALQLQVMGNRDTLEVNGPVERRGLATHGDGLEGGSQGKRVKDLHAMQDHVSSSIDARLDVA